MRVSDRVKIFTDRYPLIGPTVWMLSVQYFLTQAVVALAWTTAYSWRFNPISDLGNTACGVFEGRYVCSPLHGLMNASFITLGLTMATGSLLIYEEFREDLASLVGFSAMALAGVGSVLVGLFPENTNHALHILGAALPFMIGNVGLVVLGLALPLPRGLKLYTWLSGTVALIGLVLLLTHHYLGLGPGGMERVTAYPQTIWLISFGLYISRSHFARRQKTEDSGQ